MTHPYNAAYVPPMPMLDLYISVPEYETSIGPVQGIVDTGADGTLIPLSYLKQLSATPLDDAWIKSHWGEWRHVVMYMVDIRIAKVTIPGLYVVGDTGDEIVLGRNYLNRLRLLLDGPAGEVRLID